jgi:hypothetical protein
MAHNSKNRNHNISTPNMYLLINVDKNDKLRQNVIKIPLSNFIIVN